MARDDFSALEQMIYSGRGIIVGMTLQREVFIGYSLTGRSPSSQARKLVEIEEGRIITRPTNEEDLNKGNPALLLYPALVHMQNGPYNMMIASNGAQTGVIEEAAKDFMRKDLSARGVLQLAFSTPRFMEYKDQKIDLTTFEPDKPNYTPRISACVIEDTAAMHIVRCVDGRRQEEIFGFSLEPGKGRMITTYRGGNEDPLAPFEGAPKDVVIGSIMPGDIAEAVYAAAKGGAKPGENYRVAAAVMMLTVNGQADTAIINRCERGE